VPLFSIAISSRCSKTHAFIYSEKLYSSDRLNYARWISEYLSCKAAYIVRRPRISYNNSSSRTEQTSQIRLMLRRRIFTSGKLRTSADYRPLSFLVRSANKATIKFCKAPRVVQAVKAFRSSKAHNHSRGLCAQTFHLPKKQTTTGKPITSGKETQTGEKQ
jgi:hypothetical protein